MSPSRIDRRRATPRDERRPTLVSLAAAGLALLLSAAPAFADNWTYDEADGRAFVEENAYRLAVTCTDRGLVVDYGVPAGEIADQLIDLERASVIFNVDQKSNGSGNYMSWESNFIQSDGLIRIGVGGKGAAELARSFSRAGRNVIVGISPDKPDAEFTKYNTTEFSVKGSAAAIKALLAGCAG